CAAPRRSGRSGSRRRSDDSTLQLMSSPTLLVQIVLFQKLRPELLRWRHIVRPALRREVEQIPVRPHAVDMLRHGLGGPEMKGLAVALCEGMHHRQLHVVALALALVVRLEW